MAYLTPSGAQEQFYAQFRGYWHRQKVNSGDFCGKNWAEERWYAIQNQI